MNVIPVPFLIESHKGTFQLPREFTVGYEHVRCKSIAETLETGMKQKYGFRPTIKHDCVKSHINLQLMDKLTILESTRNLNEAYELIVREENVTISAEMINGLFYGVQTFFQLIPFDAKLHDKNISINCVKIVDVPRFEWRGALLDVGRHFFNVEFVKRFLDHLAFYKLNRFHWHLTEDQGWRIEIKSRPELTEIASWRIMDGEKYGGFYSQSEVTEIVEYAKARFIEILPEIEMPGHCGASLAAYPYLSCREDISSTPTDWGVYEDVYCGGKDKVFEFLEDVLKEVTELFPFEYIHIGGDEALKDRWVDCQQCQKRIQECNLSNEDELQTWFISRIGEFLKTRNRKIIGWDEILEGGIPENATVMSWRGMIGGFIAARLGHDVIMCPTSHCYFDYKQSHDPDEPGAFYAVLPLKGVYSFDPIPDTRFLVSKDSLMIDKETEIETKNQEISERNGTNEPAPEDEAEVTPQEILDCIEQGILPRGLSETEQEHILGGQANVWTEYISDPETCEYMLLPRICAFSEAVWSPKRNKDWDEFSRRLEEHVKLFEVFGYSFRPLTSE